ncbi:MAG: ClbS/DfsB family four-helix bundle protein [Thermoflexus sp.]|nr:ClbS/DfsB family four-helix bundle protein [Thermoflexus sp.]
MDKAALIRRIQEERERFLKAIEGLTPQEMSQEPVFGEWTVKDILAHLAVWQGRLITALFQLEQGRRPKDLTPSEMEINALNEHFFREQRDRPLERVLADFHGTYQQLLRRLERFSEEDLVQPGRFPGLSEPLWSLIAAYTFEHDAEHRADIERWRERKQAIG